MQPTSIPSSLPAVTKPKKHTNLFWKIEWRLFLAMQLKLFSQWNNINCSHSNTFYIQRSKYFYTLYYITFFYTDFISRNLNFSCWKHVKRFFLLNCSQLYFIFKLMGNYKNNSNNKKLEAYLLAVICVSLQKKEKREKKMKSVASICCGGRKSTFYFGSVPMVGGVNCNLFEIS